MRIDPSIASGRTFVSSLLLRLAPRVSGSSAAQGTRDSQEQGAEMNPSTLSADTRDTS